MRSVLTPDEATEVKHVDALATKLSQHLQANSTQIDLVHVHRAQSSAVQLIVSSLLKERLGFREEVVLTPSEGFVTHARPDFVYALGPGRGIIAEVERGGTTTNNHDLQGRLGSVLTINPDGARGAARGASGSLQLPPANTVPRDWELCGVFGADSRIWPS